MDGHYNARIDFRQIFAYAPAVMDKQKEHGALLIAVSIVASIRLRGQEIKPSPKLTATIKDSIDLARRVLAELERRD
jgi:hypothetical protein